MAGRRGGPLLFHADPAQEREFPQAFRDPDPYPLRRRVRPGGGGRRELLDQDLSSFQRASRFREAAAGTADADSRRAGCLGRDLPDALAGGRPAALPVLRQPVSRPPACGATASTSPISMATARSISSTAPPRRSGDQPRCSVGDGKGSWRPPFGPPSRLACSTTATSKSPTSTATASPTWLTASHLRGISVFIGDGARQVRPLGARDWTSSCRERATTAAASPRAASRCSTGTSDGKPDLWR